MIILENIGRTYDSGIKGVRTEALKSLSLMVSKGEFVSIVGRSGSGKTTLLNIMGCMDWFDTGSYTFDGRDIKKYSQVQLADFRNKQIGFVFQSFNLIEDMTAADNIEMPLGYSGCNRKERKKRVLELLEQVGLSGKNKNYPYQLSGGEKQRIAIARALANNPPLILADEPTGNLDSQTSEQIIEIFQDLHKFGKTIVLITHDHEIADKTQRKVTISDGQIDEYTAND